MKVKSLDSGVLAGILLLRLREARDARHTRMGPILGQPGSEVAQPATSSCAHSPTARHSSAGWHFQDACTRGPSPLLGDLMRGPHSSLPPTSSVSQTLSSLTLRLPTHPAPCAKLPSAGCPGLPATRIPSLGKLTALSHPSSLSPSPSPSPPGPAPPATKLFGAEPEPAGGEGGREEREGRRRPCLSPAASHCLTALSLFLSSQKSLHPLPPPPPCFFPSITSSLHLLE